MKWKIEKRKKKKEKRKGNSYSGDMYPNVPARLEFSEAVPYSVSFVSPKSATCYQKSLE